MKIEKLEASYNNFLESRRRYLDAFSAPHTYKEVVLTSLIDTDLDFAVYEMYVKRNYTAARSHFYTAALTAAYVHNHYETGRYTSSYIYDTQRYFCYAVLSDSSKLAHYYTTYRDTFGKTFPGAFGTAVQAVITGDSESLKTSIAKLEKHVQKKTWVKYFAGCVPAFKGLLENDSVLLEEGIQALIKTFHKQGGPVVADTFFSIEATALAKLGAKKGLTIQFDSPLIPPEMLITEELKMVEVPDYLKELDKTL